MARIKHPGDLMSFDTLTFSWNDVSSQIAVSCSWGRDEYWTRNLETYVGQIPWNSPTILIATQGYNVHGNAAFVLTPRHIGWVYARETW